MLFHVGLIIQEHSINIMHLHRANNIMIGHVGAQTGKLSQNTPVCQ